jgi:hypothetical protein
MNNGGETIAPLLSKHTNEPLINSWHMSFMKNRSGIVTPSLGMFPTNFRLK